MSDIQKKLLVVDDEPATRLLMSHIFRELGFEVHTAEDGFSALQKMRLQIPDLVLSDLNMPGMSGFEFLSVVRRRFPAIPVVAMSGFFSGDTIQPGVAADGFYQKATGLQPLLDLVAALTTTSSTLASHPPSIVPIWIPENGHNHSGEPYVTIGCPECLRTFPQILDSSPGFVKQTSCHHCSNEIHYAIVQPTDPAAPQTFQRKVPTIMPLPIRRIHSV
jgi:CheY-like chemotaxis protein